MKRFAKEMNRRIEFIEDMMPEGDIINYSLEEDYLLINMSLNNDLLQLRLPYEVKTDEDIQLSVNIQLTHKKVYG